MAETGSKHTDLTDRQLLNLALNNDQGAFASLLDRYRQPLIAHLMNYVRVVEDAEDICQRTFVKVYTNIGRYDPQYAFSTWLYTIAKNEAMDHLRRNRNSVTQLADVDFDSEMVGVIGGGNPEKKIILDQAVAALMAGIEALPETYREVAELRFIKDLSYEDIAQSLNLTMGTVKTRINRSRKMLSEYAELSKENAND